ncbi:hypothetical protein BJX62DRAFT_194646 [Aspergillus germanicus]
MYPTVMKAIGGPEAFVNAKYETRNSGIKTLKGRLITPDMYVTAFSPLSRLDWSSILGYTRFSGSRHQAEEYGKTLMEAI